MKKKITKPDGTVVEYEGTAEELAELEDSPPASRKDEGAGKGKRLLTEEEILHLIEMVQEAVREWDRQCQPQLPHQHHHYYERHPGWVDVRPWWQQDRIWYGNDYGFVTGTTIIGSDVEAVTSDSIKINVSTPIDQNGTAGINTEAWKANGLKWVS